MIKLISFEKATAVKNVIAYLILLCFLLLTCLPASAQFQLAGIFSNNMLLQRDQPVTFWGKAIPGNVVSISFAGIKRSATANTDSTWRLQFPALKANSNSQNLIASCRDEEIILHDILVGDVWVCIGQSNMEWSMMKEIHFNEEIKNGSQPFIRLYNPTYAGKNVYGTAFTDSIVQRLTATKFYEGEWQPCDSNSIKTMSAVAYYFGKEIANNVHVPIGLINLSIGGAPLETFIDKEALRSSKQFNSKVNSDWLVNDALPVWTRERGMQNLDRVNGVPADEMGKHHAYKPGFAYEAGIQPILSMPIKGILCYQGESNAQEQQRVTEYAELSKLMVDDFRKKWNQSQLPFYFVQLSSIDTIAYKGQLWPLFRNEQRKMLQQVSFSGMAVCSDIGARSDVHPINKKDVGKRLARWALHKTYALNIVPSGPLPVDAFYKKGKLQIRFQYVANGLKTSNGKSLKGFSLDGKNEVRAEISESSVFILTDKKPASVYYAWQPFSNGNLVNSEKLPASTFMIPVK